MAKLNDKLMAKGALLLPKFTALMGVKAALKKKMMAKLTPMHGCGQPCGLPSPCGISSPCMSPAVPTMPEIDIGKFKFMV